MYVSDAHLAVVAAPVPSTDRRGMSQAWYSALHLADAPSRVARCGRRPLGDAPCGSDRGRPSANGGPAAGAARAEAAVRRGVPLAAPAAAPAPLGERRAAPSVLARAIARAVGSHRGPSGTLTVASQDRRVRLVVRVDGARTRIVALCSPADRDAVAAALGAARYALARGGAHVLVDVRTET
jgi:hypothetical protein